MEHMKRMLVIAAAAVLAGAGLMYVHRNMYKSCDENVQVQSGGLIVGAANHTSHQTGSNLGSMQGSSLRYKNEPGQEVQA